MNHLQEIQQALQSGEFSQSELARAAGVSQPTVWAICHGKASPKFETVGKVYDALTTLRAERAQSSEGAAA